MKMRIHAPAENKDNISQNESFFQSGDNFKGKVGDCITEDENHHLKCHLGHFCEVG